MLQILVDGLKNSCGVDMLEILILLNAMRRVHLMHMRRVLIFQLVMILMRLLRLSPSLLSVR